MPLLHSLQSLIRQLMDISVNGLRCSQWVVVKAGILIQVISNMFSRTKDRLIQTQTDISVNMIKYNSRVLFVRALISS